MTDASPRTESGRPASGVREGSLVYIACIGTVRCVRRALRESFAVGFVCVAPVSCSPSAAAIGWDAGEDEPRDYRVAVEQMYPHASDAFTEGLVYEDGWLYESTGIEGTSSLRRVNLQTGEIDSSIALPYDVFAEGLAIVDGHLFQLSYRSGRAFVYSVSTLQLEQEFRFDGEGWGLCYNGSRLIMSDGTSTLQYRDPVTFERTGQVVVTDLGAPVDGLNELECVSGAVFANVFPNRLIARIKPDTGQLVSWIDTGGLLFTDGVGNIDGIGVLNGIAYIPERHRFLITGKYWPKVFEVDFVRASSSERDAD